MIIDVHTHFFRPELDFGPALCADMARCGVDATAWGDVGERHLETTRAADRAVVFGLQAAATGWNIPNDAFGGDREAHRVQVHRLKPGHPPRHQRLGARATAAAVVDWRDEFMLWRKPCWPGESEPLRFPV